MYIVRTLIAWMDTRNIYMYMINRSWESDRTCCRCNLRHKLQWSHPARSVNLKWRPLSCIGRMQSPWPSGLYILPVKHSPLKGIPQRCSVVLHNGKTLIKRSSEPVRLVVQIRATENGDLAKPEADR